MNKHSKRPPDRKLGRSRLLKVGHSLAVAATVATLAVLFSIIIFDVADDALALTRHDRTRLTVTLSDPDRLPSLLHDVGIIRYPNIFSLYMSFKDKELKRMSATVSRDMDYRALLSAFTDDPPIKTVRINIPKSASVSDIIDIFVSYGLGSREGFTEAINSYPFDFDFVRNIPTPNGRYYRLEGYLYPDTYDFYTGKSESYYINKLLQRFDSVTKDLLPLCEEAGLTVDQTVTIASLIECSAGFSSSYERMSGVLHNRLRENEPLSVPAASVYGIHGSSVFFTDQITDEITHCDTLYNTFENKGLPPSAVCNPTKDAILCAIYPERSDYMYFVTRPNGTVLFAKTLSEHRRNLSSILQDP